MSAPQALLRDALTYHDRGWCCIPIRLRDGEKKPTVTWKRHQTARPTEDELRRWFQRRRIDGVAIITGAALGPLAIRDFDSVPAYERWSELHPGWARELPTVRTRRGFHVYAHSDLPRTFTLPDGEYRGAGLTVAPHSTRDRFRYEWINPLPAGPLPMVTHRVLTGQNVAENAECHLSAVSAISATSSSSSPPALGGSGVSAISAFSATCLPEFVIASTQPQVVGERNMKILALARGLKFNCGMADAETGALRPLVRRWHERALGAIGTKDFDTTWADFLHAWDRARHPLGMDVVDAAAMRVDPEDLPACAENYSNENTRRLIGLCAALASLNHRRRFFLSSHVAAGRLGIDPVQAWRFLKMLQRDGVLQQLEPGNERRATRYRFIADLPGAGGGSDG